MNFKEHSDKENESLVAFFGEIEHLKILLVDLAVFLKLNENENEIDERIEFEFRVSLLFSYFHICIEYYKRSHFIKAIKKENPNIAIFLEGLKSEEVFLLRQYRNKTFHENVDLNKDLKVKEKLEIKKRFEYYYNLVKRLVILCE